MVARRALLLGGLASLVVLILYVRAVAPWPVGGVPNGALLMQESPTMPELGAPLPAGVKLHLLATTVLTDPPGGRTTVRLDRLTIPAGGQFAAGGPTGQVLIVVESGELEVTGDATVAGRFASGSQVSLVGAMPSTLSALGSQATTILRLRVRPATDPESTPDPADSASSEVQTLLVDPALVARGQVRLVLARVVWQPGADLGSRIYAGPVGLVVESGNLMIDGPSGTPVHLAPGGAIVAPAYTTHRVSNPGTEVAVALAVGIFPADPARAGAGLPTPAPIYEATTTVEAAIVATTIAGLTDREANLAATVAAQAVAASAADATMVALTDALAAARATADARSIDAAGTIAVLDDDQRDHATADAALAAELAAARATAEANTIEAAVTIAGLEDEQRDQATANAMLAAEATQAANAARDREAAMAVAIQVEATSAAAAAAAQATTMAGLAGDATALAAENANLVASSAAIVATAQVRVQEARGTIVALATEQAVLGAAPADTINPSYVEVSVQVDAAGLAAGNDQARQRALIELRRVLAPYRRADCRAGVVLTFGHAATVGDGIALATTVNGLVAEEFALLFRGAAFEPLADLTAPTDQVDIRIYFFAGCAPAETPQATSTS